MSPPKSSPAAKFSPFWWIACLKAYHLPSEPTLGFPGSPLAVRRETQRFSFAAGPVILVFSLPLLVLPVSLELRLVASGFVRPIRVGTTFYPFRSIKESITRYSLRLSTLEARTGERSHLTHGSLTGNPELDFGRSSQPCQLLIHWLEHVLNCYSQGSSDFRHSSLTKPASSPPCNHLSFAIRRPLLPAAPHLPRRISTMRPVISSPTPQSPPYGAACCLGQTSFDTTG
jgi:hypothetical protein